MKLAMTFIKNKINLAETLQQKNRKRRDIIPRAVHGAHTNAKLFQFFHYLKIACKFKDNVSKKKTLLKIDEFFWVNWVAIMP